MKTKALIIVASLMASTYAGAQEQIESILVSERDSAYYAEQFRLWQQVTRHQPKNANAWRNLYQAAHYSWWYNHNDTTHAQVIRDMGEAVPDSYDYYWCHYKAGLDFDDAEKALRQLPDHPTFCDYDLWTAYLARIMDEERLADLCRRFYESGTYSPSVLQFNYNELQGMDEGAIYFANGDAVLIPKFILQYGKGLHQDKLIVCMSYLYLPEYRAKLLDRLGIDPKEHNFDTTSGWTSQEDSDRSVRAFIDLIISHTRRPVYFSRMNGSQENDPWKDHLYNEGLTLRYSPEPYDNMAVMRRNVEQRYLMEYLLEQFTPDLSSTGRRLSASYAYLLGDLQRYYQQNDPSRYEWLTRLLAAGMGR